MEKEKLAEKIFQQFGLSFETATRAGGWTNGVWFNGDIVLRLALKEDTKRIRQEIKLAQMLPSKVGYPVNIDNGVVDSYEWSVSKRIKGINLSEAWPELTWEARGHAVKQIWEIMQAVHSVEIEKVEKLSSKAPWYSNLDIVTTILQFDSYIEKKIFTQEQVSILTDILKSFQEKLPSAGVVLNHGDITMDNILWNEGEIVSLMDFEHSVIAPYEIDLNNFINLAFFNEEYPTPINNSTEEYIKYKDEVVKLFTPLLIEQETIDLLSGFAILYNQRFIEFWLESPEGELSSFEPYRRLVSFTNNKRDYFSYFFK